MYGGNGSVPFPTHVCSTLGNLKLTYIYNNLLPNLSRNRFSFRQVK